jgi:hypothetical protein
LASPFVVVVKRDIDPTLEDEAMIRDVGARLSDSLRSQDAVA